MRADFWRGKRVLVTGHTGFKGSWLCAWLKHWGAEPTGFSSGRPTHPAFFDLAAVGDAMRTVTGDVRDAAALERALSEEAPEIVIHMAAQPIVRRSYLEPTETFAVNAMGTVNVLEAVRRTPSVRVVIGVTSDKCYENSGWMRGYRESDSMGGADPYSASKGCAELMIASFRESFFASEDAPRVASGRAGNVIGGGDFADDRLVPDLMRAIAAGRVTRVRNPEAVRPWQHVLTPLSGYLLLAERLWDDASLAEGWNFGPPEEDAWPVARVVERVAALWEGDDVAWETDPGPHLPEAHYLRVDSSKARARLGWAPVWNLEETLGRTVEWHRALRDGEDVRALALEQIDDYAAAVSLPQAVGAADSSPT